MFVLDRELALASAFELRVNEPILLSTPHVWWLFSNVLDPAFDASEPFLTVLLVLFSQSIRAIGVWHIVQ
jgi:hypothetical protein